ncbi:MAG: LysM peptidoglycan-binding domain-containing protein [Nevskia sp.]|nr:LysM peptidoglycan-binding domain-containing protein [Nevskia sp.]
MLERIDGGSAPAPQTQDYHPETDTQASAPVKQQGGQLQTTYTVQRGDSLGEVAARYQTSTQAILKANPQIHNADLINPGDQVDIPLRDGQRLPGQYTVHSGDSLSSIAASQHTTTSALVAANGIHNPDLVYPGHVLWIPGAGAQVSSPAAASPGGTSPAPRTTQDPAELQAKAAIAQVQAQNQGQADPAKALQALNSVYAKAAPDAQQKILADPYAQQLVHNAAAWANQPLQQPLSNGEFPQAQSAQALQRLDTLTKGLDPALAAQTVNAALPGYNSFAHNFQQQYGGQYLGYNGATSLMNVLDRVGTSADGNAAVQGFAKLDGFNDNAMRNAVASGDSPAYLVALASQPGIDQPRVMQVATDGVRQYAQSVQGDVSAYAGKMQELSWLVKNEGGTMTQQQLSQAIANYTKTKDGGAWQKQTDAAQAKVAADGAMLIKQLTALQNLPPSLSGQQGAVDSVAKDLVNDPQASAAMQIALNQQPTLVSGSSGEATFKFFAGVVKLGDGGRKLAQEALTAYVKSTWLPQIANADPKNLPALKQQFEDLKANSNIYKILGISQKDFGRVIDSVESALPAEGDTAEQAAAKMSQLNKSLDEFEGPKGIKVFDKSTFAGQFVRFLGVAAAGVSTINSLQKAWSDPTVKNDLSAIVSAAGLGQKGLELGVGLDAIDSKSLLGQIGGGWKLAGRFGVGEFLGAISSGLDVYNAVDSFTKGDPTAGGLYLASAGGTALAIFGADWWSGPVGVGIALAAGVGLLLHGSSPTQYDSKAMADFLHAGGVDPQVAKALVGQSGDGYSPIALLQRYAQVKGLNLSNPADQQKFSQWLDSLTPAQLSTLHDALNRAQDEFGGKTGKFNNTGGNDWEVGYYGDSGYRSGNATADSAYLLDNLLWYMHAPQLVPSNNVP